MRSFKYRERSSADTATVQARIGQRIYMIATSAVAGEWWYSDIKSSLGCLLMSKCSMSLPSLINPVLPLLIHLHLRIPSPFLSPSAPTHPSALK